MRDFWWERETLADGSVRWWWLTQNTSHSRLNEAEPMMPGKSHKECALEYTREGSTTIGVKSFRMHGGPEGVRTPDPMAANQILVVAESC